MGTHPSTIGPYRIIRQLGEGAMGAVFEAVHAVIQRRVAIKILHPEVGRSADLINRFVNEARATNLVGHPSLVQITDFGNFPDGSGYLVMEYLHGQTLSERLTSEGGKLSPEEAVDIGVQIAAAVAAVHKKDIIHRDLKPSNVMLVPEPFMPTGERVKVLDFGLAKVSEVENAAVKTNSLAVMGTPLYMSPEQCQGAAHVDAKSDVYSLGCILYEMLSGQPPFTGEGPGQIIGQHLFKDPEPLAQRALLVPPALANLVDRLLVKSKEQRPSMREAQKALEALAAELPAPLHREEAEGPGGFDAAQLDSLPIHSTLGKATSEVPILRRRFPLTAGLAGVVVSAISSVLLFWQSGWRNPPRVPAAAIHPGTPQPAPMPPQVMLRIISSPPGAQIVQAADGKPLGTTPWQKQMPRSDEPLRVMLRLNRYAQREWILSRQRDDTADVQLVATEPGRQSSIQKPISSQQPRAKVSVSTVPAPKLRSRTRTPTLD